VEAPEQTGNHMGIFGMIVVVDAVEIGGHHGNEVGAILTVIASAHGDSGDFRHRIRLVRGFEFAVQQFVFMHRLFGEFRINARGPEKHQFFNAEFVGGVDDIVLNLQI
jgi:hypothetical protein